MEGITLIKKYFPDLEDDKLELFRELGKLYPEWNARVNLVSRKDLDNLYERHILHSLAIARVFRFPDSSRILDAGTGGGFPGIPLAILFPDCDFHLVDSTAKKLVAVQAIADTIGLENVRVTHERLEKLGGAYEYAVGRALATLPQTLEWIWKNILPPKSRDGKNGLIYLKGGEMSEELAKINYQYKVFELKDIFDEEYFQTKKIVHIYK